MACSDTKISLQTFTTCIYLSNIVLVPEHRLCVLTSSNSLFQSAAVKHFLSSLHKTAAIEFIVHHRVDLITTIIQSRQSGNLFNVRNKLSYKIFCFSPWLVRGNWICPPTSIVCCFCSCKHRASVKQPKYCEIILKYSRGVSFIRCKYNQIWYFPLIEILNAEEKLISESFPVRCETRKWDLSI